MPKPANPGGGGGGSLYGLGDIVLTESADVIGLDTTPATTDGDDVIWGLGGNDEIDGAGGNDEIHGGDGFDTIFGGDGDDLIFGDGGDDVIYATGGSDTIDGGAGYDVVYYFGAQADYEVTEVTELQGKGKNKTEVVVGFTIHNLVTGETDTITNTELVLFVEPPATGQLITQGDFEFAAFDGTATLDVLANDDVGDGSVDGDFLQIVGIHDVSILGLGDADLIPDTATLDDFRSGGVTLNDGSILSLNANDTFTWDPNGAYDIPPAAGADPYTITFLYEVADQEGYSDYADVSFMVTYPAQPGTIDFDAMTADPDWLLGLSGVLRDGPDGEYRVSQLSSATGYFEIRDTSAGGDFDYDDDGDDEWRVWTEGDGTTHELNIANAQAVDFTLQSLTFIGLDAGEEATIALSTAEGVTTDEIIVTSADLDASGVYTMAGSISAGQINVVAGQGDDFWVDDVFLV